MPGEAVELLSTDNKFAQVRDEKVERSGYL